MQSIGNDLRRRVSGRVWVAGEDGFAAARQPWNIAVDQPVRAVVEAADPAEVAALVSYAGAAGLAVAAQATGHGASGDVEGVILLRTSRLRELAVWPDERRARVGAGVRWGEVLTAASPAGLTGLTGSAPGVGVVGYTLGGGLSWFSRRYGLAAHSVRAFEVVDADGGRARVTAGTDPELWWALRGGGGDFALVTAVEFDLHPAGRLYGGRLQWPAGQAPAVLAAYRALTAAAPDALTAWLELLQFPGTAPQVAVDVTYLGPAAEGEGWLAELASVPGLVADGRGPLPLTALGSITAEPTDPSPGLYQGELLADLPEAPLEALLTSSIAPLLSMQIRHLGGALTRPVDSAAGHLTEPYALYLFGSPTSPEHAQDIRARLAELTDRLRPHVTGRKPYNYLAPDESPAAIFPPKVLARLRRIKQERDPAGRFRANYPIR